MNPASQALTRRQGNREATKPGNGVAVLAKTNRKQAGSKPPLSRHPLFPAVVAIWFGALFGLGSLAVRVSLIEAAVIETHLDTFVAAAAPPLGMTARILLALGLAAVGGILGAIIARCIARPKVVVTERRRNAAPAEGFGQSSTDSRSTYSAPEPAFLRDEHESADILVSPSVTPSGRRRSLAVPEDIEPDYHHDIAPLPGGHPQIFDVTECDLSGPAGPGPSPEIAGDAPAPLELSDFPAPASQAAFEPGEALEAQASETHANPTAPFEAPSADGRPFDAVLDAFGAPVVDQEDCAAVSTATADVEVETVEVETPAASVVDFLANDHAAPQRRLVLPGGRAAQRLATAELEDLSPVELIERLALTLQNRRLVPPSPERAAPAAPLAITEDAGPAPLIPESPVSETANRLAMPSALRPIDFSEYEDHDDLYAAVPPRSFVRQFEMPQPTAVETPPGTEAVQERFDPQTSGDAPVDAEPEYLELLPETEAELAEDAYSSLLDLSRPVEIRQKYVRIDDTDDDETAIEPVVVFPGQARPSGGLFSGPAAQPAAFGPPVAVPPIAAVPANGSPVRRFDAPAAATTADEGEATAGAAPTSAPDPAETENALRGALANLQRMSGAG